MKDEDTTKDQLINELGELRKRVSELEELETERKQGEGERERLNAELQKAIATIRTLKEFLFICMSCKRIRDNEGSWHQVGAYIHGHFETEFTHRYACKKEILAILGKLAEEGRLERGNLNRYILLSKR